MPTRLLYLTLPLICAGAVACGPSSPGDAGPGEIDASGEDAGRVVVDGGRSEDASVVTPTEIVFSAPGASVLYVRGTVRLQLVTTGPDAERMELWKDGALLIVVPPPYTYDWLSDEETEGEHVFEARALIGGAVVATAERRFHVDRTPPTLIAATPLADTETALSTPVVLTFSEPLATATIDDESVTMAVDTTALEHTRTVREGDTTIELQLTAAPTSLPATAVVTLTSAITDRAGNALEEDVVHNVLYPTWIALVDDVDLPEGHEAVALEVEPTGAIWILTRAGSYTEHTLFRWEDGALGAPVGVAGGAFASNATFRLSSTGRPVVAYVDADRDVHVDTLEADGTWSAAPVIVSVDVPAIDLELGPDDTRYLAWQPTSTTIEVVSLVGGAWTRIGDIVPGRARFVVDLALDSASVPYLAYQSDAEGGFLARYAGAWTLTSVCPSSSTYSRCGDVRLAAHGDGSVRGFVTRLQRSTSTGPFGAQHTIRPPPGWTVERMGPGTALWPIGTATGYVYIQSNDSTFRDETGSSPWPPPDHDVNAIAVHEGRPVVAGRDGLHTLNRL